MELTPYAETCTGGPAQIEDFGAVFESLPGPYLLVRPDTPAFTVVAVTNDFLKATLCARKDLVGHALFETYPVSHQDCGEGKRDLSESFERVLATKAEDRMGVQRYSVCKPGGTFHRHYSSPVNIPVMNSSGAVEYLIHQVGPAIGNKEVVYLLDSTGRRRNEQRDAFLDRLENATRSLNDEDEIARTATTLLGEYLHADRCVYFCVEPDEETCNVIWDYLSPGMPSIVGRHQLSDFGFTVAPLYPDVRVSYEQAAIQAHASVPLHKAGKLVAGMAVHQRTPRIWAPEEVELVKRVANRCWESIERSHLTRALQDREQRLVLAQRAGRMGSFEWLVKENRMSWTPEIEALYGLAQGTFEGSFEDWSRRVVGDDAKRVTAGLLDSMAKRQPEHGFEFRAIMPDGTTRWLRGRGEFSYDEGGAATRMIGMNIDIDEQKAAQEVVLQTQKLESIGVLAGGIAHDFNNLLVGIMGWASFAWDIVEADHPAREALQGIVDASEQAAHLTRQMLAYAGKGSFLIEQVNLSEVAVRTARLVSASIPKSVEVKFEIDENLPCVQTDAGQIEQVAMNLLINAAESVEEDQQGLVIVRTRTQEILPEEDCRDVSGLTISPGLYAVMEVLDNGCGINVETLTKVFDPFFTTKFTGRGLGLAAVLGIVKRNQGALQVDTTPGKGSTFRILMPAKYWEARQRVEHPSPELCASHGTVLVIDDEPAIRSLSKAALEKAGMRALVADQGERGIEYVRMNHEICLVVLDMSMPGMSGRRVLEKLLEIRPTVPVMITSGYSELEVHRRFSGLPIAGILEKPFTIQRLVEKVKTVLANMPTGAIKPLPN